MPLLTKAELDEIRARSEDHMSNVPNTHDRSQLDISRLLAHLDAHAARDELEAARAKVVQVTLERDAEGELSKTLQEIADEMVLPEYRQPLKTVEEACAALGWEFADKPLCCGQEVEVRSMLGDAYQAECKQCGALIWSVLAPRFSEGGGTIRFLNMENVVGDLTHSWIAIPANEERRKAG